MNFILYLRVATSVYVVHVHEGENEIQIKLILTHRYTVSGLSFLWRVKG